MRRVVLCLGLAACGGPSKHVASADQSFDCKDRMASYMVAHDLSGGDHGVQIDCADAGPRLKRWSTAKNGQHLEDSRAMTPGEFERVWAQVDGTGWPNMRDCDNGTLGKTDPVYQFDIHDDQNKASFSCQTREVPYPYFDITNALDLAANKGRGELGGGEAPDPGDKNP